MRTITTVAIAVPIILFATAAMAYTISASTGGPCTKDSGECIVRCNNKTVAGSMDWNGNVWTNGESWSQTKDGEAKKLVAEDGTACQ